MSQPTIGSTPSILVEIANQIAGGKTSGTLTAGDYDWRLEYYVGNVMNLVITDAVFKSKAQKS